MLTLSITAATIEPDLFDLPWNLPLEEWSGPFIAFLPHGISRHVVRFVNLGGRILAVKGISVEVAQREYALLRDLVRLEQPAVHPSAVVTNRTSDSGEELNSALITEHLPFSLSYRALFASLMRPETATHLIDLLTVLLVRLHLAGFFWGDVSLSNILFRRDAGAFAGYLVDAETRELHPEGSSFGQRSYDIDLIRTNIIGELMDLQVGGVLDEDTDAIKIENLIQDRYDALWNELTSEEAISVSERWRVENRIRRLNNLGFDVGELRMKADETGGTSRLLIKPKVVDSGHYHHRMMCLAGLDVQESQGRRVTNDVQTCRALNNLNNALLGLVAHRWLTEVFESIVAALPPELQAKLEPAQIFHEVLEHRRFPSENAKREISMKETVDSCIRKILPSKPDEAAFLRA